MVGRRTRWTPWLVLAVGLAAMVMRVSPARAATLPPVRHVFIILLENKDYDVTFGPDSPAPYLAQDLPAKGQLLTQYHGIGHLSLTNYIALVSGQAPNPQTQSDCQYYTEMAPGTLGPDGQALGSGCVYPAEVQTVANQLADAGFTWKGYMEDMGDRAGESETCAHPEIGQQDPTQSASADSQYAARHNPFVYFHSIIDTPACDENVVPLDRLGQDLLTVGTTANYSFITPDLCHDAHDNPCADGGPGGLEAANEFLTTWVPKILASPAFAQDGLLIVSFDEAEVGQGADDSAACCGEQSGPNTPLAGIYGPGGGRVGAVVLSPFVTPGTTNDTPYNHYSLLRTVEDLFGLDHLGYAAADGLASFGTDVFAADVGSPSPTPSPSLTATVSPAPTPSPTGGEDDTGSLPTTGGAAFLALLGITGVAGAVALRRGR